MAIGLERAIQDSRISAQFKRSEKEEMAKLPAISIMPGLPAIQCSYPNLSNISYLLPTTTIRVTGRGLMS